MSEKKTKPDNFSLNRASLVTCHEEFRDFSSVNIHYCHFKWKHSYPSSCPSHAVAGRTNAAWQEKTPLKIQLNNGNETFALCFMNAADRYHLMFPKTLGLKHSYGKSQLPKLWGYFDPSVSQCILTLPRSTKLLTYQVRQNTISLFHHIAEQDSIMDAHCDRWTILYKEGFC